MLSPQKSTAAGGHSRGDAGLRGLAAHLLRLVEVVTGSPAARAGLRTGDLVLTVGRSTVTDAQGIQRQLFSDAIGSALPITALRNGAMVDVVAVPAMGVEPRHPRPNRHRA